MFSVPPRLMARLADTWSKLPEPGEPATFTLSVPAAGWAYFPTTVSVPTPDDGLPGATVPALDSAVVAVGVLTVPMPESVPPLIVTFPLPPLCSVLLALASTVLPLDWVYPPAEERMLADAPGPIVTVPEFVNALTVWVRLSTVSEPWFVAKLAKALPPDVSWSSAPDPPFKVMFAPLTVTAALGNC